MPSELLFAASFALALGVVLIVTPLAIRLAGATGFLDRPHSYKGHASATPYLGGLAVVTATMAVITFVNLAEAEVPGALVVGLLALFVLGTVDDRVNLGPWLRIAVTCVVATGLWVGDVGWSVGSAPADLALTVLWVLAVVNAFNLMDNMDGAAASVGAASAAGIAALAITVGATVVGALALAVAAACLGFLRYNLAGERARIFLGDGGSMPLGLLLAALVMALSQTTTGGDVGFVLAVVPLVGVAALDTALVMWSRRRRGVPLWSGGRDHLTHRVRERFGGRRLVAARLAVAQVALGGASLGLVHAPAVVVAAGAAAYLVLGVVLIRVLESNPWRTPWMDGAGTAGREQQRTAPHGRPARAT